MNETHVYLASPEWAAQLKAEVLPWITVAGDLGDDLLEIGPGPGGSTDLLRELVPRVTAIEVDRSLAEALHDRLVGTNVEVIWGDGADTGLAADRFSTATAFSVLHHVPTTAHQDRVLAEIHRVLCPGGLFVGIDSLDLDPIRQGHEADTFVPVDPERLPDRLQRLGFARIEIDRTDYHFRFATIKAWS